jgi:hypothetical protein
LAPKGHQDALGIDHSNAEWRPSIFRGADGALLNHRIGEILIE